MAERKKAFCSYLSAELAEMADFLAEREKVSKVVFVRQAIQSFMDSDHTVDDRLRITEKSNPDYVNRGVLYYVNMDEEQSIQLKLVAYEEQCTVSQLFFQIMLNYCARLIEENDDGIVMDE